jgi:mono/diheme cytochrome c family protein
MSDADMGAIIAYLQTLPEQEGITGKFQLQPIGWWRRWMGELPPDAAELIDHTAARPNPAVNGTLMERGAYLAKSVCTECHSDNGRLRVPITPDLEIALTYTEEEFVRLMRTGAARGEREIDHHMLDVGKYRYFRFSDAEVDALWAYTQSLAE